MPQNSLQTLLPKSLPMRLRSNLLALLVPLALALPAIGSTQEVAVVSLEVAVRQTDYFQQQLLVLQQDDDYKTMEEEGQSKLDTMRDLQQQLGRDAATMSKRQFEEIQGRVSELSADLKLLQTKIENRQKTLWENTVQELNAHVQEAVSEVIKARNVKVLITRQAVLYADELVDVTDDVSKVINRLKLDPDFPPAGSRAPRFPGNGRDGN